MKNGNEPVHGASDCLPQTADIICKHRILILGSGFAGLYAAMDIEKRLKNDPSVEICIVNRDNFFLFTPMLHEVAASDLDLNHIVNPVRKLLRRTKFIAAEVEHIDLEQKIIVFSHGFNSHTHELPYTHLILSLGSTTNFFSLPGLQKHAITIKSLADAVHLRNRLIALLEEAEPDCAAPFRGTLLTFVVAGAGFAGVETIASINDFVRNAIRFYPSLRKDYLRFVLVHPGEIILPELDRELGKYTERKLKARGVEIHINTKVTAVTAESVQLSDGATIATHTLIWAAGSIPHPLVQDLPCEKLNAKLLVNEFLEVSGWTNVWALGDCALIPDGKSGTYHPPTAQHALREGKVVALNVIQSILGGRKKRFSFSSMGQLAAIGHRTGVANILGVKFSGFIAWWMWRTIYLAKLPRLEKKIRVALDWTLDLLFSKDLVQFMPIKSPVGFSVEEDTLLEEQGPDFIGKSPGA